MATPTVTGTHDLNGVTVVEIHGWDGRYQVLARNDGGHGIVVESVRRQDGEMWTFARPVNGVLVCFSNARRISALDLLPMAVNLPPDKIGKIEVRFR